MQATTQMGLKRLMHFSAVWDRAYDTQLVVAIGKSESLIDSLQIIERHQNAEVKYQAEAFAFRIPYINLNTFNIDHYNLVSICDPTRIPNANYAGVAVFGQNIWVVTDKPTQPVFRQKLRELLKDYIPVIVTANRSDIGEVAEEARKVVALGGKKPAVTSSSDSNNEENVDLETVVISKPVENVPVITGDLGKKLESMQEESAQEKGEIQRAFYPVPTVTKSEKEVIPPTDVPPAQTARHPVSRQAAPEQRSVHRETQPIQVRFEGIPGDAIQKFEDAFRKLNKACASEGKEVFQLISSVAYGFGVKSMHITPGEVGGDATCSLRTPKGVVVIGKIRMANYGPLGQLLREAHNMGPTDDGKNNGVFQVRYMLGSKRLTMESECFAKKYAHGQFEAFHFRFSSNNLPLLPELFDDAATVKEIETTLRNPGIVFVASTHLDARREFMGGIVACLEAGASRVAVLDCPAGNNLRFSKLPKESFEEDLNELMGMDLDAVVIGEADGHLLRHLTKYACGGYKIIAGISVLSVESALKHLEDRIGVPDLKQAGNALIFLDGESSNPTVWDFKKQGFEFKK